MQGGLEFAFFCDLKRGVWSAYIQENEKEGEKMIKRQSKIRK